MFEIGKIYFFKTLSSDPESFGESANFTAKILEQNNNLLKIEYTNRIHGIEIINTNSPHFISAKEQKKLPVVGLPRLDPGSDPVITN